MPVRKREDFAVTEDFIAVAGYDGEIRLFDRESRPPRAGGTKHPRDEFPLLRPAALSIPLQQEADVPERAPSPSSTSPSRHFIHQPPIPSSQSNLREYLFICACPMGLCFATVRLHPEQRHVELLTVTTAGRSPELYISPLLRGTSDLLLSLEHERPPCSFACTDQYALMSYPAVDGGPPSIWVFHIEHRLLIGLLFAAPEVPSQFRTRSLATVMSLSQDRGPVSNHALIPARPTSRDVRLRWSPDSSCVFSLHEHNAVAMIDPRCTPVWAMRPIFASPHWKIEAIQFDHSPVAGLPELWILMGNVSMNRRCIAVLDLSCPPRCCAADLPAEGTGLTDVTPCSSAYELTPISLFPPHPHSPFSLPSPPLASPPILPSCGASESRSIGRRKLPPSFQQERGLIGPPRIEDHSVVGSAFPVKSVILLTGEPNRDEPPPLMPASTQVHSIDRFVLSPQYAVFAVTQSAEPLSGPRFLFPSHIASDEALRQALTAILSAHEPPTQTYLFIIIPRALMTASPETRASSLLLSPPAIPASPVCLPSASTQYATSPFEDATTAARSGPLTCSAVSATASLEGPRPSSPPVIRVVIPSSVPKVPFSSALLRDLPSQLDHTIRSRRPPGILTGRDWMLLGGDRTVDLLGGVSASSSVEVQVGAGTGR